jgi:hypothetical protein
MIRTVNLASDVSIITQKILMQASILALDAILASPFLFFGCFRRNVFILSVVKWMFSLKTPCFAVHIGNTLPSSFLILPVNNSLLLFLHPLSFFFFGHLYSWIYTLLRSIYRRSNDSL